jgi:hypothetical protein
MSSISQSCTGLLQLASGSCRRTLSHDSQLSLSQTQWSYGSVLVCAKVNSTLFARRITSISKAQCATLSSDRVELESFWFSVVQCMWLWYDRNCICSCKSWIVDILKGTDWLLLFSTQLCCAMLELYSWILPSSWQVSLLCTSSIVSEVLRWIMKGIALGNPTY